MEVDVTVMFSSNHISVEKTRKIEVLQQTIHEFEVMVEDLDDRVKSEENLTGIKDASRVAYSTYAKAAAQRRDKLKASIESLRKQLVGAIRERDGAIKHDISVPTSLFYSPGREHCRAGVRGWPG